MVYGANGITGIPSNGYNPSAEISGPAKISYERGVKLYGEGNYDEALKRFTEALALAKESKAPNSKAPALILRDMARCYVDKGQPERAIETLKDAKAATSDEKLLTQIDADIDNCKKLISDKKPGASATDTAPANPEIGPTTKGDKAAGGSKAKAAEEQAPPPKPFEVTNSLDVLRMFGINIEAKDVDEDHNGTVSDDELNKYLRAKGIKIDVADGFQWEEVEALAKKYGVKITKAYFDTQSVGGTDVTGDGTVTIEDAAKFNRRVIQRLSQGTGKPQELIRKYMATENFKMMDANQAVSEFSGRFGTDKALFVEGGQVSVKTLVSGYIRPELQDISCIILSNILGKPVKKEDIDKNKLKLTPDQLLTFFMTMYVLGKVDKPGEILVPSADSRPKLEKESPLGFLEWLTTGTKNKVDAPKEEKKAGESGKSEESKTISSEEARKLNDLMKAGNSALAISYLEELEKKYPDNLLIKDMLAEQYDKKGNKQKALEKAAYTYEKDPSDDRKKALLKYSINWYTQVNGKELNADQKVLAARVIGILRPMADSETDKGILAQIKLIISAYNELKEEPLPGQVEFQKMISADGAKIIEVKAAYDKFADALAAGIVEELKKPAPDKTKLAKMYGRLAQIEMTRRNFSKAREYTVELVKLYPALEGDAKDKAKAQIKDSIEKLCTYRHADRIKEAQLIIKEAEDQKILGDLSITITVQKKGKKGLEKETEEKTVKSAADLNDMAKEAYRPTPADEAAIYVQGLPAYFSKVPKGAGRIEITLPLMYMLETKGCLTETNSWSAQFAKSKNIPAGDPKNPAGKFKTMETAQKYLQWLIYNAPYEQPKAASAASGGDA